MAKKKGKKKGRGKGAKKSAPAQSESTNEAAEAESPKDEATASSSDGDSDDEWDDGELAGGVTLTGEPEAPPWEWKQREGEPNAAFQLRRFNNALGVLEAGIIAALMVLLIGLACYQALAGRLANKGLAHGDEIIIYSVFWIALFGASLAAQRDRLISMDLVARNLPVKGRAIMRMVLAGISVFLLVLLIKAGLLDLEVSKKLDNELIGRVIGVTPFPICMGLIAFHIASHAVIDLLYLMSGKEPPQAQMAAH